MSRDKGREPAIRLSVNGEQRTLDGPRTLARFLAELDFDPHAVAVEYNGEILKRAAYAKTELADGDRLEIVRFVQGG